MRRVPAPACGHDRAHHPCRCRRRVRRRPPARLPPPAAQAARRPVGVPRRQVRTGGIGCRGGATSNCTRSSACWCSKSGRSASRSPTRARPISSPSCRQKSTASPSATNTRRCSGRHRPSWPRWRSRRATADRGVAVGRRRLTDELVTAVARGALAFRAAVRRVHTRQRRFRTTRRRSIAQRSRPGGPARIVRRQTGVASAGSRCHLTRLLTAMPSASSVPSGAAARPCSSPAPRCCSPHVAQRELAQCERRRFPPRRPTAWPCCSRCTTATTARGTPRFASCRRPRVTCPTARVP